MCEKLDSHVYVEPNMLSTKTATFLMLGNWCGLTSVQTWQARRCAAPVPWLRMTACPQVPEWISPRQWERPPPLLWLKSPFYCDSERVSGKTHHLCWQSKSIQLNSKFFFLPRNEICHHRGDACWGWDAFAERRKMQYSACAQVSPEKIQFDLECAHLFHQFNDSFVSAL